MERSLFNACGFLDYYTLTCIELRYLLFKTWTKRTCNDKQEALLNNMKVGGAMSSSVLHAYETLKT